MQLGILIFQKIYVPVIMSDQGDYVVKQQTYNNKLIY